MASQRPRTKTASMATVETVQGTHSFKITNYSLHKQLSTDKCFYSDGKDLKGDNDSVFLELTGELARVTASFEFRMVNPVTGLFYSRKSHVPMVFSGEHPIDGFATFMRKNDSHKYVEDGCLVIV
ncbi:unnamed protein product [Urochloa humidicola]